MAKTKTGVLMRHPELSKERKEEVTTVANKRQVAVFKKSGWQVVGEPAAEPKKEAKA